MKAWHYIVIAVAVLILWLYYRYTKAQTAPGGRAQTNYSTTNVYRYDTVRDL